MENKFYLPGTEIEEASYLWLKAKAEAQGYKISKAKMKDTCAEIYALDAKGTRTELFLDPTNGAIVAKM